MCHGLSKKGLDTSVKIIDLAQPGRAFLADPPRKLLNILHIKKGIMPIIQISHEYNL